MSSFLFAVLVIGSSGIIAQLLLLRELFITFLSNELTIGIILANWLLLESAGSFAVRRIIEKIQWRMAFFVSLILFFSVAFPLSIYYTRIWKECLGMPPGEGLGLLQAFYSSFILLLPVSVSHGALFTSACRIHANLTEKAAVGIGTVYSIEIVGTIAGGLLFTCLMITRITSFDIALTISLANCAVSALILLPRRGRASDVHTGENREPSHTLFILSVLMLAAFASFLVSPLAENVHVYSIKRQWPAQDVVHYQNSIYGNVAVTQRHGQFTFFSNGIPAITAPTPDIAFVEEFAHLPLLFHGHPEYILVISGGAGGVLHEILKHPVDLVDYAELDPLLIELVDTYSTPLTEAELGDPRVQVHSLDGRLFLKESPTRYDVIFIGLSNPHDLQTNRFFTGEFFSLAYKKLKKDGMIVFSLPGSTTYMSDELKNLNACIIHTIEMVFPSVIILPGEGYNLLLASPLKGFFSGLKERALEKLDEGHIPLRFLTPFQIEYKLNRQWSRWFDDSLAGATRKTNQDFRPLAVYYSISFWNAQFSPGFQSFFAHIENVNFRATAVFLCLVALPLFFLRRKLPKLTRARIPLSISLTGFAGMIFELALIFAFQALYGYVYFWVGLLVTAFMAGGAVGSFVMTSKMDQYGWGIPTFLKIEVAMIIFSGLLPLVLVGLEPVLEAPSSRLFLQAIFLVLSVLAGMLIGLEFPLAGKIHLRSIHEVGDTAGLLYGADLLGGWAGGIIGGVMLLPVFGLFSTCMVVAILKIISILLIMASSP